MREPTWAEIDRLPDRSATAESLNRELAALRLTRSDYVMAAIAAILCPLLPVVGIPMAVVVWCSWTSRAQDRRDIERKLGLRD